VCPRRKPDLSPPRTVFEKWISTFPRKQSQFFDAFIRSVFSRQSKSASGRTVLDDWIGALPRDKFHLYDSTVHGWDRTYAMSSVMLNEALSFRARGKLVCAQQQLTNASQVLGALGGNLIAACEAMGDFGRHISQLPAVEPLDSELFRFGAAQHAASWNGLLHHVLFGSRSRFFHKLRILSETLESLIGEFSAAAEEAAQGMSAEVGDRWHMAEALHDDVNTCLCEVKIVLKSFLRNLPNELLAGFTEHLKRQPAPLRPKARLTKVTA